MTREEVVQLRAHTARYLATARSATGMSAEKFARAVGLNHSSYCKIVMEEQLTDVRKLMRAERLSGVQLEAIDARIRPGLKFIRDAARAVEHGATVKKIARGVKCNAQTLRNCIGFARELEGAPVEHRFYAPGLLTVIKYADRIAAMPEAEIAEMYGASRMEEIGARAWVERNFGPEIAATMRATGENEFEFRTDSQYVLQIKVGMPEEARFRAFFQKEGNRRLSIERRIQI